MSNDKKRELGIDDIAHVAELMKTFQPESNQGKRMDDSIIKISTVIVATLLIWAGANIFTNSQAVGKIKDIDRDLRAFTDKPRFTAEDFAQEIKPIVQLLERHDAQLSARQDWMLNIGTRVTTIENNYGTVKRDLEDLESNLQKDIDLWQRLKN